MMMKNKKASSQISFKKAVETTEDIKLCYKEGLTALGKYSAKVSVSNLKLLQGSVDIDKCTSSKYPNSNRWDYAFSYDGEVFFVEVHSANSREVSTVLRKLQWLKDWLNEEASEINKLKAKNKQTYYWIQSKRFAIPKTSPQYRAAINAGIRPISILKLS